MWTQATQHDATLNDSLFAPVNTISYLTSYEQVSPAARQLALMCQARICPTSLSETSGHEIPNSLQCRARLQISYRHMQTLDFTQMGGLQNTPNS